MLDPKSVRLGYSAALARSRAEVSALLDDIITERERMRAQLDAAKEYFDSEAVALRAELHECRVELHRLHMIEVFRTCERDWSALLH